MKTCCRCKISKNETEFSPRPDKPSGLYYYCKKCACASVKKKYWENPEAARERTNRKRRENPEIRRKYIREAYMKNPEPFLARARKARRLEPEKAAARVKKWRDKNPGYGRERKYGLSQENWEKMVLNQGGKCAICEKETKLCVDHDHETGKVRGLLCLTCNQGIGSLKDSSDITRRATEYLKKYGK